MYRSNVLTVVGKVKLLSFIINNFEKLSSNWSGCRNQKDQAEYLCRFLPTDKLI